MEIKRETYRALGAVLKTKQTEFAIVQAYYRLSWQDASETLN